MICLFCDFTCKKDEQLEVHFKSDHWAIIKPHPRKPGVYIINWPLWADLKQLKKIGEVLRRKRWKTETKTIRKG